MFFIETWKVISEKYKLTDFTGYFELLPVLEEIIHATQYGLEKKFYRDHLNHNIRAALLSAYIMYDNNTNEPEKEINEI